MIFARTSIDLSSLSDTSIASTISLSQSNDLKVLRFKFNHFSSKLTLRFQGIEGIDAKRLIPFEEFISRVNEVFDFAPNYDYKNVPSNGYRSLLKIWTSMMEISVKEFEHDQEYSDLMVVIERMNKWFKILNESNEMTSKDVHDDDLGKEHLRLLFDLTDEESMRIFLGEKLVGLACHPIIRSWIKIAFRASALFGTGSMNKTIKCLWTYDDALQHYVEVIRNLTPDKLASIIRIGDWTISKKIANLYHVLNRGFYRVNKCTAKSVHPMIPSPYLIKVTSRGSHLEANREGKKRLINCRICSSKSSSSCKNVMVYLHGGAFFGLSGEILEHLYLKDWVEEIPGLTIISVNYSLCPENKFPVALQEIVDFYLWLTSGSSEVIDMVGFAPQQIILSGDSSGGNLAAASLLVLNDISVMMKNQQSTNHGNNNHSNKNHSNNNHSNNLSNEVVIKRPKAIALFYPKIMLRMEMLPSTLLTNFDLIINQCIQLTICESYLPLIKRDYTTSNDGEKDQIQKRRKKYIEIGSPENAEGKKKNDEEKKKNDEEKSREGNQIEKMMPDPENEQKMRQRQSCGTEKDEEKEEEKEEEEEEKEEKAGKWILLGENEHPPKDWMGRDDYNVIRSPYLTPYAYTKFEELADVKLSIMAMDCDPFLDESITMAKKWKGTVDFRTVDHLPHGCFVLKYSLPAVHDCLVTASQMIQNCFS